MSTPTSPPTPPGTNTTRVDELFGEGRGAPRARVGFIASLLASGTLLTVLGFACSTVPGGLLLLAAWVVVEKDFLRLEAGFLPLDQGRPLRVLRALTLLLILLATASFVVQTYLMQVGFYTGLWGFALEAWLGPP